MSDDKDDLNGFDGLGKTNDDGMHFSEEELEAAMAGFEKEFQDEEVAQQNDAPAQVPFDQPDETVNSDASSDESQDGLQSKEADAVLSEAENSLSFDDELQGLLGNRAKVAVIITRLASARLFAAFCQLSDISAQCLASPQGAVAVLRNLDGDGPEAAIKDLTTVVSGMPAVLAINRADKLEATMYLQGKVGQTFAPPVLHDEAYTTDNNTDFSVQLGKIKDSGAELLFLPNYYSDNALILQQAHDLGLDMKIFGVDGMDGILNVENFDTSLAEGVMLLTPFSATGEDEATVNFVKAYGDANNGETPNQFAADAYDVLYAMKAAADDAGITPDMSNEDISAALSASMLNITVNGLTGEAKWTEDGECDKAPKAYVIKDGVYASME